MEAHNPNRIHRINFRLTEVEHQKLLTSWQKSSDHKLSDYGRKLLLGKPVTFFIRDRSLDLFTSEMAKLRKELKAIGNNFNQVVRRINGLKELPKYEFWLQDAKRKQETLLEITKDIQQQINKNASIWYQRSSQEKVSEEP